MKILFTAVGGSDPIKRMLDGPMLHSVRVYKPDIVYLYLTKKMCEYENTDSRYSWAINKLADKLGKRIEIVKFEREDAHEVHLFDSFYTDFEEIIDGISEKYPDAELYLNASSGTPAIKSTLVIIAAMSKKPINVIQVSGGEDSPIHNREKDSEYENELFWESNIDNEDNFKDRTTLIKSDRFLAKVKKNNIEKFILKYDYEAALGVANEIKEYITDDALALLKAAGCRVMLDHRGVINALKGKNFDIIPQKTSDKTMIAEYILWLGLVLKKGDYLSFIRGITPASFELMKLAVKETKIGSIENYCTTTKNNKGNWLSIEVMSNTETGREMLAVFESEYENKGGFKECDCGTDQLKILLENFSDNEKIKRCAAKIRKVEGKVRNEAAHTIISLNNEDIKNKTDMSANEIYETIKEFAIILGVLKNDMWSSYEDMNKLITDALYRTK